MYLYKEYVQGDIFSVREIIIYDKNISQKEIPKNKCCVVKNHPEYNNSTFDTYLYISFYKNNYIYLITLYFLSILKCIFFSTIIDYFIFLTKIV